MYWKYKMLWLILVASAWGAEAVANVNDHADSSPKPPVFPDVFFLKYTFSMPHFYLTQPNGLSYPVSVWYDGPNNRRRVDAYDGEDSCVTVEGYDYTVIPRIDKLNCDVWGEPGRPVYSPLPDLSRWDYGGTVDLPISTNTVDNSNDAITTNSKNGGSTSSSSSTSTSTSSGGQQSALSSSSSSAAAAAVTETRTRRADIWQRQIKEGDKVSQYTFYVSPEGVPLRLNMIGVNYLTNAHFDEYVYDFTHFDNALPNNASSPSANIFDVPPVCKEKLAATQQQEQYGQQEQARQHPAAWQLGAVLPDIRSYDHVHAYNLWSRAHGRIHADAEEYDTRLEAFRAAVQRVQAHNARPDASYSMRLNHWADWQPAELAAALQPNKQLRQRLVGQGNDDTLLSELPGPYRPMGQLTSTLPRHQLPSSVDWRGTGADPGIKDQGMCGSCYAFAATGAMDGAWYVATGQRRSFSEQQIVDCAWEYGPNGCFGGYYQSVFSYVADAGGIALEQDYTYRGEVGWCRSSNHSLPGRFSGYWAVKSRDEHALMEAVWKYGPIAVSIDADPESFRYYSEGVYDEPSCSHRAADLDHTVTLFGYGTSPEGKDYWLVRNSWAKYYGDDGYIRIVRGPRDCGVATDPAVAAVSKEWVREEAQRAAREEAARWDDA